jgi:hypothetical protein
MLLCQKALKGSFKDLEKTSKRTKSGYFKLKRILDSGLYRRQNHTAMRVLVEALEAYNNLRSYSIDKELREVDDMLVKTKRTDKGTESRGANRNHTKQKIHA